MRKKQALMTPSERKVRDMEIICMRLEGKTFVYIANHFNISEPTVSKITNKAASLLHIFISYVDLK